MIFAFGKPGEQVRAYVQTTSFARAQQQAQEGEVWFEVAEQISGATIGPGNVLVPPEEPDPKIEMRARRDRALAASDWTQLPDALHPSISARWAVYRKALRDFPDTGIWPKEPS